ncbi:Vitamin B12 ABC transporter, B12-binding component BtuF [invertebrate metagenome]|uniref:Vitamin B12 ABC transporter, B12-binding component BtuF n=1 Tax=invertebrate metagenome TaxID=1711999 RepID=A0A484H635_9ZZZZ
MRALQCFLPFTPKVVAGVCVRGASTVMLMLTQPTIVLLLLALLALQATAEPQVVSTALCADQMVVALVDSEHILALSPQARDNRLSAVVEQAKALPSLPPAAEALVFANADVVVGMTGSETQTLILMEQLGVRVLRLEAPNHFTAIARLIRIFSTTLGASARGEGLAVALAKRWAAAKAMRTAAPRPPLAAYYRPDGGSAGHGTFVDVVLGAAGFENLATALGYHGWGRLDLETLTMNPPEGIVAAFFHPQHRDTLSRSLLHRFSHHPIFRTLWRHVPVLEVPGSMITCASPVLTDVVEYLARKRSSLRVYQP